MSAKSIQFEPFLGMATVSVTQRVYGGQWNLLGSYPFVAGTGGSVTVRTDDTDRFVTVDAVKFELIP
ncbi:hypothetical protein GCM10008018_15610 [Paenibacillus marchantiophytorum]|uniref:Golvesin/Xly CBD-like domain-containing protein n=1 Tax=Paenibacillus marchantiophytorum TaxID=1619310 RepID=A0ABQ2BTZ6_9BACL|nr:hypothetical protein [Paenibacillus marchantiophytorum]GGI46137.1 hypothetical protein GCM10008018_15610 [Paenibacillus marchantiophytorum]